MLYTTIDSPLGPLLAAGSEHGLSHLLMDAGRPPAPGATRDDVAFADLREQLDAYFAGELRDFTTRLAPVGGAFEQRVWSALLTIPYGETLSYGALAHRIGAPRAARAVGLANGRNPIAILIPCHRVIGAGGALTGYAGGLARKRTLLDLEAGITPLPYENSATAAPTNP
jgi:methylated-DNA-[protein]-cysteine S-methyltransferase